MYAYVTKGVSSNLAILIGSVVSGRDDGLAAMKAGDFYPAAAVTLRTDEDDRLGAVLPDLAELGAFG